MEVSAEVVSSLFKPYELLSEFFYENDLVGFGRRIVHNNFALNNYKL